MSRAAMFLLILAAMVAVNEGCGTYKLPTVVTIDYVGQVKYIKSPNYPCDYFHDLECVWRVDAPNGKVVAYNFARDVHIEYSANACSMDVLEILDLAANTKMYMCGRFLAGAEGNVTTSRQIAVVLKTDGDTSHHGFKLAVTAAENENDTGGIPSRPASEVGECRHRLKCYECSGSRECSERYGYGRLTACDLGSQCGAYRSLGKVVYRNCYETCTELSKKYTSGGEHMGRSCCSDRDGCNAGNGNHVTFYTVFLGAILSTMAAYLFNYE